MRWMTTTAVAVMYLIGTTEILSAAEPIATTDGEAAGMSLQVTELKVSNGTVMLKFAIVNDGDANFAPHTLNDSNIAKADGNSVSGVYLIDVPNKKKYFVVVDTDGHCICSRDTASVKPNSRGNLWAKFPAPPDSVSKIGLVFPHFLPMDDVPLSR